MDKFTARRRLLRGSLSAPLVLTVASSPAAAAARGSWEACLYRAGKNPETAEAFRLTHDTWLRKQVDIYSFAPTTTSTSPATTSSAPQGTDSTEQVSVSSAETVASGDGTGSGVASTVEVCQPGDYYELNGRYYPVPSDTEEDEPSSLSCHQGYSAEGFCEGTLTKTDRSGLVLVYVDNSGTIVAYGPCPPPSPNEGFPVSGSCWASFGGMQGVG